MSSNDKTIEQQLAEIAQALYHQESRNFVVSDLVSKFKTAAENYRHDQTINQVAFVLEKVAATTPYLEISGDDLKSLASQFHSADTNFYDCFKDLLPEADTFKTSSYADRIDFATETKNLAFDGSYQVADPSPFEDTSDLIDKSISYVPEDLALVRQAVGLIDEQLKQTGKVQKTSSILRVVKEGTFLFETKIKTAAREVLGHIPLEVSDSIPLFPDLVAVSNRTYPISRQGIELMLSDLERDDQQRKTASQPLFRSLEDYELALRNDSIHKYAEEISEDDQLDIAPIGKQATLVDQEIEQILMRAVKAKDSKYGEQTRNEASRLIKATLTEQGMQVADLELDGDLESGLSYFATLNTETGQLKVKVAVEINNSIIFPPTSLEVRGSKIPVSKTELLKIATNSTEIDSRYEQTDPLMISMSYPDLKKQLKYAAHNKKPKLAKRVIALIEEKFGSYYGNAALDDYQTWLEESISSYQTRCGDCNYYIPKTSQAKNDYCNLVKTATRQVERDPSGICTRATYAGSEDSIFFDGGNSVNIKLD